MPPTSAPPNDVADQLAGLACKESDPSEFFGELLRLLGQTLPLRLGAVWGLNHQGVVERIAERIGNAPLQSEVSSPKRRVHDVLQAITSGQPSRAEEPAPDAERIVKLLQPLRRQGRVVGVIEVAVDGAAQPHEIAAADAMLRDASRSAESYLDQLKFEKPAISTLSGETGPSATAAEVIPPAALQRLHESLSVEQVAMIAANEARRCFRADRVTVAVCRRGVTKVVSISGRDRIAEHSTSVVSLRRVAELAAQSNKSGRFSVGDQGGSLPLDQALAEHAVNLGARHVVASPLTVPAVEREEPDQESTKPIGVLVVESFNASAPHTDGAASIGFAEHAAIALANAVEHERLAGAYPSRLVGRFFGPRDKSKRRSTIVWGAIAVAVSAVVALVPISYRVEATGQCLPAERSRVFAPMDAEVVDVSVASGQRVEAGQLLLRLTSRELDSKILAIENRVQQLRQTLAALNAEADELSARPRGDALLRLQGRISQTEIEIEGAELRLRELRRERSRLEVRAPHAGSVATFDPEGKLRSRPVSRGEALIEVMRYDGPWELLIDCPVDESGRVVAAAGQSKDGRLAVDFVLATRPEERRTAELIRIGTRAEARPEGPVVLPIEAIVNSPSRLELQRAIAGSEVLARIDCGKRPLAYVLFGGLYDRVVRWFW